MKRSIKYFVLVIFVCLLFCTNIVAQSKHKRALELESNKTFFDKAFFQSVVTTLIGSLVGAGLAIPAGLWLDRKVKNRESQKLVLNLKNLLYCEIIDNQNTLVDYISSTPTSQNKTPDIIMSAWQVAISQKFLTDSDDIHLNTFLSKLYYLLENTKMLSNNYLNLLIIGHSNDFGRKEKLDFIQNAIVEDAQSSINLIKINIHLFNYE